MNISRIFAENLFAFHYKDEEDNELYRLLDLWNDPEYLQNYFIENEKFIINNPKLNISSETQFIDTVIDNAQDTDEILEELSKNQNLEEFFIELSNTQPLYEILSKRKGRKNILRIYAIKIDENCFVITGGAIKITDTMQQHKTTTNELKKLKKCKAFLLEHDVIDSESFYELLNEL